MILPARLFGVPRLRGPRPAEAGTPNRSECRVYAVPDRLKPELRAYLSSYKYRLFWTADDPYPANLGRVIATRLGRGGLPGKPILPHQTKIVIDFAGGPLENLDKASPVQLMLKASSGKIENDSTLQVVITKHWRVFFDIEAENMNPVDIRVYLRLGDQALTETWRYQYLPYYRTLLG